MTSFSGNNASASKLLHCSLHPQSTGHNGHALESWPTDFVRGAHSIQSLKDFGNAEEAAFSKSVSKCRGDSLSSIFFISAHILSQVCLILFSSKAKMHGITDAQTVTWMVYA